MIALSGLSGLSGLFASAPGVYVPPYDPESYSYFTGSYFASTYFTNSYWA